MESGSEGYQKAVFSESQWFALHPSIDHPSFYQLDTKLRRILFSLFLYIRTSVKERQNPRGYLSLVSGLSATLEMT